MRNLSVARASTPGGSAESRLGKFPDRIKIIRRFILGFILAVALSPVQAAGPPRVVLHTSMGDIELQLYPHKAPITVNNFLQYVRSGFYNGTVFHRVIFDWIIQGGGYDRHLNWKKPRAPIKNEADNGLKNVSGTIAMARAQDPNSADSQFFINISNNPSLDHKSNTSHGFGYCVFGKVVHGMDVVKAISEVETHEVPEVGANVPLKPIVLERADIVR
jgi:cyclophilin family peptidyl-prolyl cis-trans isomerase